MLLLKDPNDKKIQIIDCKKILPGREKDEKFTVILCT